MPEIPFPIYLEEGPKQGEFINPLISELTEVDHKGRKVLVKEDDVFFMTAENFGYKRLGEGIETRVISHEDKTKAHALSRYWSNPLLVRIHFYEQRIAHTLWPHNYPRTYSSYRTETKDQPNFSGAVRQRIYKMKFVEPGQRGDSSLVTLLSKVGIIKYPYEKVIEQLEQWNLPINTQTSKQNFIVGNDGGVYYVDKVHIKDSVDAPFDFTPFMKANNYSEGDTDIVTKAIERIHILRAQWREQYGRYKKQQLTRYASWIN